MQNQVFQNYKSFDRDEAAEILKQLCCENQLCLENLKKIRFIQRKHELQIENLEKLVKQANKDKNCPKNIKELICSIVQKSIQLGQVKDIKILEQLEKHSISEEMKSTLQNEINQRKNINKIKKASFNQMNIKFQNNSLTNQQCDKVKQQQKEKQKIKYKNFEENQTKLEINFSSLKNKSKSKIPDIPQTVNSDGDLQTGTKFSSSYTIAKNILKKVQVYDEKLNKKSEEYLVQYLQGKQINLLKAFSENLNMLYKFSVDDIIIDAFLHVSSRKFKRQILSFEAIKYILELIKDKQNVRQKYFKQKSYLNLLELNFFEKKTISFYCDHQIITQILNHINNRNIVNLRELDIYIDLFIEKLRIKSIQIIYEQCLSTNGIIGEQQFKQTFINAIEQRLNDSEIKIVYFANKILKLLDQKQEKNFLICLDLLEKNYEPLEQITYINEQTKDFNKVVDLFNLDARKRIISLIKQNIFFDDEIYLVCIEVINNYLYHLSTQLSDEELEMLVDALKTKSSSKNLVPEILRSILICSQKRQNLPQLVVQHLSDIYQTSDDNIKNQIIVIIGFICENQIIPNMNIFHLKLFDQGVVILDGDNLQYEQRTEENINFPTISEKVVSIFYIQMLKGNQLKEYSIRSIFEVLQSSDIDLQLQVKCLKTLNIFSNKYELSEVYFDNLFSLVEDEIIDVCIYSKMIIAKQLYQRVEQKKNISLIYINMLDKIFISEEIEMFNQSEINQLNEQIIKVLLYALFQQNINNFEENIYQIFNYVLNSNTKLMIQEVFDILNKLIQNNCQISYYTIMALENLLDFKIYKEQTLNLFQNLIYNGQSVSEEVLKEFSNNLIYSNDINSRNKSFNLLDKANSNQDLSDQLFNNLEIQRASMVIIGTIKDNKDQAISFLEKQSSHENQIMPVDALEALQENLSDQKVLNILENISQQQQNIPIKINLNLINQFEPSNQDETQRQILRIIRNMVQKNYEINVHLVYKLEYCFNYNLYNEECLDILNLLAQREETLTDTFIDSLCLQFIKYNKNDQRIQLFQLIHLLFNSKKYPKKKFVKVYTEAVTDIEDTIFEQALDVFEQIVGYIGMEQQECLDEIFKRIFDKKTSDKIKQKGISILNQFSIYIDGEKELQIQLFNLENLKKLDQFLDCLEKKESLYLQEENFLSLSNIMDQSRLNQIRVAQILIKCQNQKDIPSYLVNKIAQLYGNTTQNQLQIICFDFLKSFTRNGFSLSQQAIYSIQIRGNFDDLSSLKMISQQNYEFYNSFSLEEKIKNVQNQLNLQNLYEEILKELDRGQQFNLNLNQQIISIIAYQFEENLLNWTNLKICAKIFCNFMIKKHEYKFDQVITKAIEKCIINFQKQHSDIIQGYVHIIRTKNYIELDTTISKLQDLYLNNNYQLDISLQIIKCIIEAMQIINQYNEKHQLIFEKGFNSNHIQLKYYSFKGLRILYQAGLKSSEFLKWCSLYVANQADTELSLDSKQLDLLETISSLKFCSKQTLTYQNNKDFQVKLIMENIFSTYKMNDEQKSHIEKDIKNLQQREISQKKGSFFNLIQSLNNDINSLTFEQFRDLLTILNEIADFEKSDYVIQERQDYYSYFQQLFIKQQLKKLIKQEYSSNYYEKITLEIIKTLGYQLVKNILSVVKQFANDQEFEDLFRFLSCNPQIKIQDIQQKQQSVESLKQSLQIILLKKQVTFSGWENIFVNLLKRGFSYNQLNQILKYLTQKQGKQQIVESILIEVFRMIDDYDFKNEQFNQILQILNNEPVELWIQKMHKKVIQNNFNRSNQKQDYEIIQELAYNNPDNGNVFNLTSNNRISHLIKQVRDEQLQSNLSDFMYKNFPEFISNKLFVSEKPIQQWENCNIQRWSQRVKSNQQNIEDDQFLVEALAVINRAIYLNYNHFKLSCTQITSCILFFRKDKEKGLLLQIATGEGKSIIICVITIIQVLLGQKVDIVTTSPVLAERDVLDKKQIYEAFQISVGCNVDNKIYNYGVKQCYNQDVVYGDIDQYKFDYLRDNFSGLGTLGNRTQQVVIVDEVDSITIDESTKIARLSSSYPGMDLFQHFIFFINMRHQYLVSNIITVKGELYLLDQESIQQKMDQMNGDPQKDFNNLIMDYINKGRKSMDEISTKIEGDVYAYLKNDIISYIEYLIAKKVLLLPNNLVNFKQTQLSKWVDSLLNSYKYEENVDFIVSNGVLKPLDYNTGVIQNQTSYGDGLHQILQLKYNIEVSTQSITTNFISNFSYLKKYKNNIYGLTGTLGSNNSRNFIKEMYNVDLVNIPTTYHKNYIKLPDMFIDNYDSWNKYICQEAVREARKNRGILIICENIKITNDIHAEIKNIYNAQKLILYNLNQTDQEKQIQQIIEGQIIISTNLSIRGVDIKTSQQIEKNGGLHVILTYKPINQRIEFQGLGRTARFGRRGTSRLIINSEKFKQLGIESCQAINSKVNELENYQLIENQKQIEFIYQKDELLADFCLLLNKLRSILRPKNNNRNYFIPTFFEQCVISSVEEQWEQFLRNTDQSNTSSDEFKKQYKSFKKYLLNQFETKKFSEIIKNPYYLVQIGFDILVNKNKCYNTNEDQEFFFEKAYQSDNYCCPQASIGMGLNIIQKFKNQLLETNRKNNIIEQFERGLKAIQDEQVLLELVNQNLEAEEEQGITYQYKQIQNKQKLLAYFAKNVEDGLRKVKCSMRFIDITANKNLHFEKQTSMFFEIQKDYDRNQIHQIVQEYDKFSVTFNDLIAYQDIFTQDQAIDLIKDIKKQLNKTKFNINLKNIDPQIIQSILNPHIENNELNKQQALDLINLFMEQQQKGKENQQKVDLTINSLHQQKEICNLTLQEAYNKIKLNEGLPYLEGCFWFFEKIANIFVMLLEWCDAISFLYQIIKYILYIIKFYNPKSIERILNIAITLERTIVKYINHKRTGQDQLYNLRLLNQNKNHMILFDIVVKNSKKVIIEYLQLNQDNIQKILKYNSAQFYDIQIIGSKNEILNLINSNRFENLQLKYLPSSDSKQYKFIQFRQDELINQINQFQNDSICVLIENIEYQTLTHVIEQSSNLKYDLKCRDANIQYLLGSIKNYIFNMSFTEMDNKTAENLIKILRKENIDFSTTITQLCKDDMKKLDQIQIKQESIQINEIQPIEKQQLDFNTTDTIQQELKDRGYQYIFKLEEIDLIPKFSIICILICAAIQFIVGFYFSFVDPMIAFSIIMEGVIDLYTAYQVYNQRKFCWKQYLLNKSLAVVADIASRGLNKVFKVFTPKKLFLRSLIPTVCNLGNSYLQEKTSTYIRESIQKYIKKLLEEEFQNPNLQYLLIKMLAVDAIDKKDKYKIKINQILEKIKTSDQNLLLLNQIGQEITLKLGSNPKLLENRYITGLVIFQTISGIFQIYSVKNKVMSQFVKELIQIDSCYLTVINLLQKLNIGFQESRIISESFQKEKLFENQNILNDNMIFQKINFNKISRETISHLGFPVHEQAIIQFFSKLDKTQQKFGKEDLNYLINNLSKIISDRITQVVQTNLLSFSIPQNKISNHFPKTKDFQRYAFDFHLSVLSTSELESVFLLFKNATQKVSEFVLSNIIPSISIIKNQYQKIYFCYREYKKIKKFWELFQFKSIITMLLIMIIFEQFKYFWLFQMILIKYIMKLVLCKIFFKKLYNFLHQTNLKRQLEKCINEINHLIKKNIAKVKLILFITQEFEYISILFKKEINQDEDQKEQIIVKEKIKFLYCYLVFKILEFLIPYYDYIYNQIQLMSLVILLIMIVLVYFKLL